MKKIKQFLIVTIFLVFLLMGCSKNFGLDENRENISQESIVEKKKLNVVVTLFPQYDFVREIAGDRVNLSLLIPPGSESHTYEPTPQDIVKIQRSDIFIYIGGTSDVWIDNILDTIDISNTKVISLLELVDAVEEEYIEGMEVGHEDEDEVEYDEHVWTSPQNAQIIVKAITRELIDSDPDYKTEYQQQTDAYLEKLSDLEKQFEAVVEHGVRKTIVFGDRFPFRYLADAYGLDYYAAFPGCSTETEPGAGTIAFLIDKVKGEKIPVVFHIELSNEKIADTICEATGAKKLLLHTCHNLTRKEFESGITYLELMQKNVENLKEALY